MWDLGLGLNYWSYDFLELWTKLWIWNLWIHIRIFLWICCWVQFWPYWWALAHNSWKFIDQVIFPYIPQKGKSPFDVSSNPKKIALSVHRSAVATPDDSSGLSVVRFFTECGPGFPNFWVKLGEEAENWENDWFDGKMWQMQQQQPFLFNFPWLQFKIRSKCTFDSQ